MGKSQMPYGVLTTVKKAEYYLCQKKCIQQKMANPHIKLDNILGFCENSFRSGLPLF